MLASAEQYAATHHGFTEWETAQNEWDKEGNFPVTNFDAWEAEFEPRPRTLITTGAVALSELVERPAVYEIPNLEIDASARTRAEQLIGQAATGHVVERPLTEGAITSLLEAIRQERRKLIEMNVRTDFIERTIKSGHIMKVDLQVDSAGQIVQHGQSAESIQANSLRFASGSPQMRSRTHTETRNMYRIQDLYARGLLQDYAFVVFSRAADDMSEAAMQEVGFFTDTMSSAIQVTTAEGAGLTTESAFVAGKKTPTAERHDGATLEKIGEQLNVNLRGTATQQLDTPLLIPKYLIPNGAIDVVKLYDEAAGGTFFGKDEPMQDYLQFREQCRARELELEPTVQEVVNQLMAEANSLQTPTDATRRLHELSGAHLLRRAITDIKIDGTVFGTVSAFLLEGARYEYARGNMEHMDELIKQAIKKDESKSCPGAGLEANNSDFEDKEGSGNADCDYVSKKCPMCNAKNVRTIDKGLGGRLRKISGSCGCSKVYAKAPTVPTSQYSLTA